MADDDETLVREAAAELTELLEHQGPLELVLRPQTAFQLCALLQLALRHPGTTGDTRRTAIMVIEHVRAYFADAPAVLEMIRRGDDPDYDVQTDPTAR